MHAKQAVGEWQWDGSQAIVQPGHVWRADLSKVTAPPGWTEVSDGTEPKKDGPLGNTEIKKPEYWNAHWTP